MSGKYFKAVLLVYVFTVALVLGFYLPSNQYATAAGKTVIVTGSTVNVRSGPGIGYNKVGSVNKGAKLEILDQKSGWYKLKLTNGGSGWVTATYLQLSEAVNRGTAINAQVAGAAKTVVIGKTVVNVRNGPGTNHQIVAKANIGQNFKVINQSGDWYNVDLGNGRSGWVAGWLVTVKLSRIPSESNVSVPTVGQTAKLAVIKGTVVNIRSGPGTGNSIVSKVIKGQKFSIIEQKGDWLKISLPSGKIGWVANWVVNVQTAQPVQQSGNTVTPDAKLITGQYLIIKEQIVNVRSGPGTGYSVVAKVRVGDRLTVTKQSSEWYMVNLPGSLQGWVAGWLTEVRSVNTPSRSEPSIPGDNANPSNPPKGVPNQPIPDQPIPDQPIPNEDPVNEKVDPLPVRKLQAIEFESRENVEETLEIMSEGEIKYAVSSLKNPSRLVVDIESSDLNGLSDQSFTGNLVSGIRAAQFSVEPMTVRVVLDLNKPVSYVSVLAEDNKTLVINLTEPTIKGKIIVIDAGHGGYDPGAVGITGLEEKSFNLDTVLILRDKLQELGATVILTREDDSFLSLSSRANVANSAGADIFVSVHANASEKSSVNGTSTYYYAPSSNSALYAQLDQRIRLAGAVQGQLIDLLGTRNIGILQDNFAVLRGTLMPSILIEAAFLSNPGDEALLKDSGFRERVAQGITEGLVEYFNSNN